MILANLLFLFSKVEIACYGVLDLVRPPKMAHSLLYSNNHATNTQKKDHYYLSIIPNTYNAMADNCSRSLMKKVLDKCVSLCYNRYIIENKQKPIAAQPVNISPFTPQQEKTTMTA